MLSYIIVTTKTDLVKHDCNLKRQTLEDQTVGDDDSFGKTYLISLAPLPDARGLNTKEGKRVLADNN